MKIRFYPKKEVVLNDLRLRLNELRDEEAAAVNERDNYSKALIQQPGRLESLNALVEASIEAGKVLSTQIAFLESHDPAEVLCEIDLAD